MRSLIIVSFILISACATQQPPQNAEQFIGLSTSHNFFVTSETVTVDRPYASVIKSVTPIAKNCFTGSSISLTPGVAVSNGTTKIAKIKSLSDSSSQLTIQIKDVTMPIAGAPDEGSF